MSKKVSARVVQPDKQTAILLYGDVPAERLDEMEKRLRTEIGFRDVERVAIGLGSDKYWSAGDGCSVLWNAAGLMQKL